MLQCNSAEPGYKKNSDPLGLAVSGARAKDEKVLAPKRKMAQSGSRGLSEGDA